SHHVRLSWVISNLIVVVAVPTASEESCNFQKKREATAVKDCTATKVKKKLSVKVK
nr:hypothetical protein [Tanacetum cinerariifolium]